MCVFCYQCSKDMSCLLFIYGSVSYSSFFLLHKPHSSHTNTYTNPLFTPAQKSLNAFSILLPKSLFLSHFLLSSTCLAAQPHQGAIAIPLTLTSDFYSISELLENIRQKLNELKLKKWKEAHRYIEKQMNRMVQKRIYDVRMKEKKDFDMEKERYIMGNIIYNRKIL